MEKNESNEIPNYYTIGPEMMQVILPYKKQEEYGRSMDKKIRELEHTEREVCLFLYAHNRRILW